MEQHKSPSCQRVVGRGEGRKDGNNTSSQVVEGRKDKNSGLSSMPVFLETSSQNPRVRKSIKKEKKVNKEKKKKNREAESRRDSKINECFQ